LPMFLKRSNLQKVWDKVASKLFYEDLIMS